MKVESITIQNFKRFENIKVSFKHKTLEEVSNRFLVLGDNGMGKTTLLQAIALPLALATRQIQSVADFDWLGFLPERFWKWGPPQIQLEVSFEDEEIEATREIVEQWYQAQSEAFRSEHPFVKPSAHHSMPLSLIGDYWKAGSHTLEERLQFQGRYYAQQWQWLEPSAHPPFSKLPGIFWFDQFRNVGVFSSSKNHAKGKKLKRSQVSFELGVDMLRERLIKWLESPAMANNSLTELENLYQKMFPERTFNGTEYMPSFDSPMEKEIYFLVNDGHRTYDLAEMSAGEQSIVPILHEFVRQQIGYSVVLIDEVDLNLHPPAAQFLIRQLLRISSTCQFIFTTHSEAVSDIMSGNETWRLLGGALCL
jgi:predicted ATPase